jgi:hypothetical protein
VLQFGNLFREQFFRSQKLIVLESEQLKQFISRKCVGVFHATKIRGPVVQARPREDFFRKKSKLF